MGRGFAWPGTGRGAAFLAALLAAAATGQTPPEPPPSLEATLGEYGAAPQDRSPARGRAGVTHEPTGAWTLQGPGIRLAAGFGQARPAGDHRELLLMHGVQLERGATRIFAQSGVILFDEQKTVHEVVAPSQERAEELPRRSTSPPDPRRVLDEETLRARVEAFLRAAGSTPPAPAAVRGFDIGLFQSLYLEGDVVVVQDGIEVLRCRRMYWSTLDDRAVFDDAELRLPNADPAGPAVLLVVRGERLRRQGPRFVGRDVTVTTCTAGEPHFAVRSGEVEILEEGRRFEVRTRNNHLLLGGNSVLPLPDTSFYTGEQSQLPIKGASVGWSQKEKWQARLDLGGPMNDVGGAVHEFLTGRDASEFRGEWLLGLGFNHARGFPLRGGLDYRAGDLYFGRILGFWLDDRGKDLREIRTHVDGSPIDAASRSVIATENRVRLGPGTTLDLTAFSASDPAVWPEFFGGAYLRDELPETSLHLRSAADNRLLTVTGRTNLNDGDFSYDASRRLTPSFVAELPLATFDWFSEPLITLPGDTPLLLTSSTSAGYLRREFDDRFAMPADIDTLRVDQILELAAPFHASVMAVRPFVEARFTHWQDSPSDEDLQRWAFTAGAQAGTRLSRTFRWRDADGLEQAARHDVLPTLTFANRFDVQGVGPLQPYQFDEVDELDERMVLRAGVLNMIDRLTRTASGEAITRLLWLDLAQNVLPAADRDNDGHLLGLFEYELELNVSHWLPVPGLRIYVEGEHDWQAHEERTLDAAVRFGPVLGIDWLAEYRADFTRNGTLGYGASTQLLGRWALIGHSQYDLEEDDSLNYTLMLQRHDHDWILSLGLTYDVVEDQTTVFANFEPTLGGLIRPRTRYLAGIREYGSGEW